MDNAVDALHLAFVAMVLVIALSVAIYMITMARQTSEIVLRTADDTAYLSYELTSSDLEGISNGSRIVGFETIIPTLFKYNFERYAVVFMEGTIDPDNGLTASTKPLYTTNSNKQNWDRKAKFLRYSIENDVFHKEIETVIVDDYGVVQNSDDNVYAFDITEENYRNEWWTDSPTEIRKHLEAVLFGQTYYDPKGPDSEGHTEEINYSTGNQLYDWYTSGKDEKFIEFVGHYTITEEEEEDPEGEEEDYEKPIHRGNKTTSKTVIIYVHIPD